MKLLGVFLLLAVLIFSFVPSAYAQESSPVVLACLNIGKADCMLLMYKDHTYLIDTGYEQNAPALFTALSQLGIPQLDGVFLTHCHEDHQGGLMPLAKSDIPVEAWYAAALYHDVKEDQHPMVLAAGERGKSVVWLSSGDRIYLEEDTFFTVLGPLSTDTKNENNNSLVLHFSSPQGSILLAGDMKEEEEEELLRANLVPPADVLKCGHHGDNKATGLDFLRAVQPKAALILTSALEEKDTPAPATLSRLAAVGCNTFVSQDFQDMIWVTLQNGAVSVYDVSWNHVPSRETHLQLIIDSQDDRLLIKNTGDENISLANFQVYSTKGNELLSLPEVTLPPGETYIIGSRMSEKEYHLLWNQKRVWHKSKTDHAILYDGWGRPVACTDNGKTE